jgi:hypothetical protein
MITVAKSLATQAAIIRNAWRYHAITISVTISTTAGLLIGSAFASVILHLLGVAK